MPKYSINHTTRYTYFSPVGISTHLAHLRPLDTELQSCDHFSLEISPTPEDIKQAKDYFGNTVHHFSVHELHEKLTVSATSGVTITVLQIPKEVNKLSCAEVRAVVKRLPAIKGRLIEEYTYASSLIPFLDEAYVFAEKILADERPFFSAAFELCQYIFKKFEFDPMATNVSTPLLQLFQERKGVCQDFAHVMIACLRAHRLPASYVSGYLLTNPPPGKPRLIGADASHAWVSIYLPEVGWIDMDPTNNKVVSHEHITVARGRDFADVSPLKGSVVIGGHHKLSIEVTVTPIETVHR